MANRLHRFYVADELQLKHDFWVHDERLIYQWNKVLRFRVGDEVILFDGTATDRLYKIQELNDKEAHLTIVTDYQRKTPSKEVYLLWSLLKKDKNDWVLQKGTELGVSHFLPLLADRSEKTGFNIERAEKIVIEAAEQCGRSDIPTVREPMHPKTAVDQLRDKVHLYICEQNPSAGQNSLEPNGAAGVLIGPEGGWSDPEKQLFIDQQLDHLVLSGFTLRAETAAVTAAGRLVAE